MKRTTPSRPRSSSRPHSSPIRAGPHQGTRRPGVGPGGGAVEGAALRRTASAWAATGSGSASSGSDPGLRALAFDAEESLQLHSVSAAVTYDWGMIPIRARVGATEWTTSLFPEDGGYVLPVKDAVRRAGGSRRATPSRCG
jgi:hypothetical protein